MMRQYLSVKEMHPDALLFYRMGDFYEMFFQDAELASRALEITLTSRNKNDASPIPMCGVPVRAVQGYIARLIELGFKVAICDQVEDPSTAKGLVKREVSRVITPGMIIENELLDARSNNYILALHCDREKTGLSCLDISTGAFRLVESKDSYMILDEALRISPREVLLPETFRNDASRAPLISKFDGRAVTFIEDRAFDYADARGRLIAQFKTRSLEGFGCEDMRQGVCAAGALLHYVQETQKQAVGHFAGIETYSLDSCLLVDDLSCRNLELLKNIRNGTRQGALIEVMDKTRTAMGSRMMRQWLRYPLLDTEAIRTRQDAVQEAREKSRIRKEIQEILRSVYDLERLGSRIVMGHGNARDLLAIKQSLEMAFPILIQLESFRCPLFSIEEDPGPLAALVEKIEKSIRDDAPPVLHEGGIIKPGFNAQLDELIEISTGGKRWLIEFEAREKKATGINSLKVRYNKVFGYYIEIPKARIQETPAHYVRKQTLVNAERYITDELKTYEANVLGAEERRSALEYEIFDEIRQAAIAENPGIQKIARFVARLDCLSALSEIAETNHYCRPEINTDGRIEIEQGRHPVIEQMMRGERYVPNDIRLDMKGNQVLVITGPNMAGKSTVLRQTALTVIMAQMGSFVPAEKASICITDRIFTRVGALDNLSQGQSTFMVEMEETARILHNATKDSLVILDEIGRGTSTFDGLSIAWAVVEYLHDLKSKGVKTLFATHYHELTDLSLTKARVKNYNIAVKEWNEEIIFLRKLVEGGTNRSYGIQVARLAGIPDTVIERAKRILADIEDGKKPPLCGRLDAVAEADAAQKPVQLALFRNPSNRIVAKLIELDISRMTPLEALNCLSELQEKTKSIPV